MIGQTLGHYSILDKLGEGGMGEVYRAEDAALGRQVALKVLPPHMSGSQERLQRFQREAKTLASLNHPNIVTVFSVEKVDDINFLTMELLEGQTMADFLPPQGVPIKEFLRISIDLADALSSAHDSGVIHRDLKPSNVFVTTSGRVKVLDFGLAKQTPVASDGPDSRAPTDVLTGEGRVLGTVPYMSPEQLQGKQPDARSDIFSLGIILYQLATGDRPFKGATSVDIISSILRDQPTPVDDLRSEMPHHIGLIVGMCLEKDPDNRIQSAKDLRNELTVLNRELSSGAIRRQSSTKTRAVWKARAGWIAAVVLALMLMGYLVADQFFEPQVTQGAMRIPMPLPEGLKPGLGFGPSVAVSPDGRHLGFALEGSTGSKLYLKGPNDPEARPIAGTEGARTPFFAPDGRWIAFFDEYERKLKKISLGGGEPITITDADYQWGADWAEDGTIVFSSIYTGLMRVSEDGGPAEPITEAEAFQHSWPSFLPGDEKVLFTILTSRGNFNEASIAAVPLSGGEPKIIFESAYFPHYASTGHLVFVQNNAVVAAPFDPQRLEVTGPVVTVFENVWTSPWTGYADFAFSDSGTLLYISGGPDRTRSTLERVDLQGKTTPILSDPLPYTTPTISPDGQQLAFTIGDNEVDLWIYHLGRKTLTRFTDSPSWDAYPQWRPGSDWIAFSSMREGLPAIFQKGLVSEKVERLFVAEHPNYPYSWSPDGQLLAYIEEHPETGQDIWVHSRLEGTQEPFLQSDHNESNPAFSPDSRFIAYESDESGRRYEIYVRPYPEFNPAVKISTQGGLTPRWGPDGTQLFYVEGRRLMVVDLEYGPSLTPKTPNELFEGDYGRSFDVSLDGQWFVMINEMAADAPPMRINYVANWYNELKARSQRALEPD